MKGRTGRQVGARRAARLCSEAASEEEEEDLGRRKHKACVRGYQIYGGFFFIA